MGSHCSLGLGPAQGEELWPGPTAPGCPSCTCILFTIISCSTRGWVSPVRFMVPSSSTTACTVGKPVLFSCSECTESMVGMLGGRGQPRVTGALQGQIPAPPVPTPIPWTSP